MPNVSICAQENEVHYNPKVDETHYLAVESVAAGIYCFGYIDNNQIFKVSAYETDTYPFVNEQGEYHHDGTSFDGFMEYVIMPKLANYPISINGFAKEIVPHMEEGDIVQNWNLYDKVQ